MVDINPRLTLYEIIWVYMDIVWNYMDIICILYGYSMGLQ